MKKTELLLGHFRKLFALEAELKQNDQVLEHAKRRAAACKVEVDRLREAIDLLVGGV